MHLIISPDLDLKLECNPAQLVNGEQYTYVINVTNRGTHNAENITLVNQLCGGVEHVSSTVGAAAQDPDVTGSPQLLTWEDSNNIGTLAPGDSVIIEITILVTDFDGTCTNIATATASNAYDTDEDNSQDCPLPIIEVARSAGATCVLIY